MSNRDPMYALLEYRNTPIDGLDGYAPAQLLNGRLLRSRVPTPITLLKPHIVPPMYDNIVARQKQQQKHFNARARPTPLSKLPTNQEVVFRAKTNSWKTGHVATSAHAPRSYVIKNEQSEYRRNRKDIRPIPAPTPRNPTQRARAASQPMRARHVTAALTRKALSHIMLSQPTTTRSGGYPAHQSVLTCHSELLIVLQHVVNLW